MSRPAETSGGPPDRQHPDEVVRGETLAMVRVFLSELAEGTTQYRSLHSLTREIEHQYHGRFAIELLQNAHDALRDAGAGRVAFELDLDEGPAGVLYVANDGAPFEERNFRALVRLGQSSKDPQHDVGNKGIGFRSVLEVCEAPEVYSAGQEAGTFDGYCFRFDPGLEAWLLPALEAVRDGATAAVPGLGDAPLVDWTERTLEKYRARCRSEGTRWLRDEVDHLSPYALPLPLDRSGALPPRVAAYAREAYATVVRLPLRAGSAPLVEQKLRELVAADTALFLGSLKTLRVTVPGDAVVVHRRKGRRLAGPTGREVVLTRGRAQRREVGEEDVGGVAGDDERRYWVWTRRVGGDRRPAERDELARLVARLPGRWPELREADVSVAVRVGAAPEPGLYSVFLPTLQPTGTGAHLNAPFYAKTNREQIRMEEPYNRFLLAHLAELALDAAGAVAGAGNTAAQAVADLLAPTGGGAHDPFWQEITRAAAEAGPPLEDRPLFKTDRGWFGLRSVRVLGRVGPRVFSATALRRALPTPLLSAALDDRASRLEGMAAALGISLAVRPEELAEAAQGIAEGLLARGTGEGLWRAYWSELSGLLPSKALIGKRVLLGADGRLYEAGAAPPVFLPPIRGDIGGTLADLDLGPLQDRLVLLHEAVPTSVEDAGGRVVRTALTRYLVPELVQDFRRDTIYRDVLLDAIPDLPVPIGGRQGKRCLAIFRLAQRLLDGVLVAGYNTGDLPVPCAGGWIPASEAAYGPGWEGTVGEPLARVLEAAGPAGAWARDRLVLPPDHPVWKGKAAQLRFFLDRIGVGDGLRLRAVGPGAWRSEVRTAYYQPLSLPPQPPAGFTEEQWGEYRARVARDVPKTKYRTEQVYRPATLYVADVLSGVRGMGPEALTDLTEVLVRSFALWRSAYRGWGEWTLTKQGGEYHQIPVPSPLHHLVEREAWMRFEGEGEPSRPSERWWVDPELLRTWAPGQFAHLRPIPAGVAARMRDEAKETLARLGMPSMSADDGGTAGRLLDALSKAWSEGRVLASRDVFAGQVLRAWRDFDADGSAEMPGALVVRRGAELAVWDAEGGGAVYLPDVADERLRLLRAQQAPIVEIRSPDAQRLAAAFEGAYGGEVQRVSRLEVHLAYDGEEGPPVPIGEALPWLPAAVLAVRAYHGQQSYGTRPAPFQRARRRVAGVRLSKVNGLRLRVEHGARSWEEGVGAWYDEALGVIFVDVGEPGWARSLSGPLATVMERDDVDVPLRLLLTLTGDEPDDEAVERALGDVGVGRAQYSEVRHLMTGTWGDVAFRLRPALALLALDDLASSIQDLTEEEALRCLASLELGPISGRDLVEAARGASDPAALGRRLYAVDDGVFELARWNEVLRALGAPYRAATNAEALGQFEGHLLAAGPALRAAVRAGRPASVGALLRALAAAPAPAWLAEAYWDVPFAVAMASAAAVLSQGGLPEPLVEAVRGAADADALADALRGAGADLAVDPSAVYARNHKGVVDTLKAFYRAGLAYAIGVDEDAASWVGSAEAMRKGVEEGLDPEAYLDEWDERAAYLHVVRASLGTGLGLPFWEAAVSVGGVRDLVERLGVAAIYDDAARKLEEEEEGRAAKRRRSVSVLGVDVDSGSADLTQQLWDLLEGVQLPGGPQGKVELIELARVGGKRRRKKKGEGGGRSGGGRNQPPERVRRVVGVAGEVLAYRYLRSTFGENAVTPAAWLSEIGGQLFPGRAPDDGAGYDFEFSYAGVTYCVEVKATMERPGREDAVDLGASEIKAALERKGKRNTKWVILRISDALSDEPSFEFLPNPFERSLADRFDLERSQLRVGFRRAL